MRLAVRIAVSGHIAACLSQRALSMCRLMCVCRIYQNKSHRFVTCALCVCVCVRGPSALSRRRIALR